MARTLRGSILILSVALAACSRADDRTPPDSAVIVSSAAVSPAGAPVLAGIPETLGAPGIEVPQATAAASHSGTSPSTPIAQRGPSRATDIHGERPSAPLATADTAGARATIVRLEREARAIAKTTGCHRASECRSAPVGAKACGGPRTYIVYCAASTDTIALMRKLRELERTEKAYNEKSGMASTCEMRLPPVTELVGGSCRETSRASSPSLSGKVP